MLSARGLAAISGLTPGDIILKVDEEDISSLAHFMDLYKTLQDSKQKLTMLFVQKGALTRFVLINRADNQSFVLDREILDHVE